MNKFSTSLLILLLTFLPFFSEGHFHFEKPISTEKISSSEITCIQSNTAGDITISWTQASDPTNLFLAYEVHTVQNGLLTTINSITTTSYTQLNVNQQFDYFIKVVSIGNSSISSTKISNIFLTLSNPSDGTAILQWNNPLITKTSAMNDYYRIYREYPTNTWTLIDSVRFGATFYKDTIDICSAFLNYKIELPNQPCDFSSNIKGDNFKDLTSPDIPKISNVSIDTATNKIVINWIKNRQTDTQGYIVYEIDPSGAPTEIATINGLNSNNYSYTTNVSSGTFTYSVAAFDFCLTPSNTTFQTSAKAEIHTTMNGKSAYNICNKDIHLTWSEYKGWNTITNYEIWGHQLGKKWEKFGETTNQNFHTTGEALKDYCFAIKAISNSGDISFSNSICLTLVTPSQPKYNYLKAASINNNKVEITHYIENISGIKEIVYQRLSTKNVFEEIGRKIITSSNITFIDSNVYTDRFSYTYRAVVIDSCENYGAISNTVNTLLLTIATNNDAMTHYLNWNRYAQFKGSLIGYAIYKGDDGIFPIDPLTIVTSDQLYYEDTITNQNFSGKTCYYVKALESSNIYGNGETVKSNTVCSILEPIIYIPNSFTPNGDALNQLFLPQVSRIEISSYSLTIFDRWEHIIYETSNPEKGWNGEIKSTGNQANVGSYIYLLRIKNGNGVEVTKRGTINLIK